MNKLVLIDAHALLHRAYHAFPKTIATSKGVVTNAVYGFTRTILALLSELEASHMVVAFDKKGPTFRHHKYKDYKGSRPKVDQELIDQFSLAHEVVEALGLPIKEKSGFEADDVIGTIVERLKPCISQTQTEIDIAPYCRLDQIIIVTGDKDALQLVDEGVQVYMPSRGKKPARVWDTKQVVKKMGVRPDQIVDLKALMGDASDDIPGVKGIGPKTAKNLLKEWDNLENIYNHLDEIEKKMSKRIRFLLEEEKEVAFMSQDLAEIFTQAPIKVNLRQCLTSDYDKSQAVAKFEELEFRSLINKLPNDNLDVMVDDVFNSNNNNPVISVTTNKVKKEKESENKEEQMGLF